MPLRDADVVVDFTHHRAVPEHAAGGPAGRQSHGDRDDGARTSAKARPCGKRPTRIPDGLGAEHEPGREPAVRAGAAGRRRPRARLTMRRSSRLHHRHKQDAPSGTALALAAGVAAGRGQSTSTRLPVTAARAWSASRPRRADRHACRARRQTWWAITRSFSARTASAWSCRHRASSRDTFAMGALRAAVWVAGATRAVRHAGRARPVTGRGGGKGRHGMRAQSGIESGRSTGVSASRRAGVWTRWTGVTVTAASAVYETEPVDVAPAYRDQAFLNAVLIVEVSLAVTELTAAVHAIETAMGRVRGRPQRAATDRHRHALCRRLRIDRAGSDECRTRAGRAAFRGPAPGGRAAGLRAARRDTDGAESSFWLYRQTPRSGCVCARRGSRR